VSGRDLIPHRGAVRRIKGAISFLTRILLARRRRAAAATWGAAAAAWAAWAEWAACTERWQLQHSSVFPQGLRQRHGAVRSLHSRSAGHIAACSAAQLPRTCGAGHDFRQAGSCLQ